MLSVLNDRPPPRVEVWRIHNAECGTCRTIGHFLRQEMQGAPLAFMIEYNTAGNVEAITFTINLGHLVSVNFGSSIGVDRVECCLLVLRGNRHLPKHFGRRCMINTAVRAMMSHRLEKTYRTQAIHEQGFRSTCP